jgi:hypothetical protein
MGAELALDDDNASGSWPGRSSSVSPRSTATATEATATAMAVLLSTLLVTASLWRADLPSIAAKGYGDTGQNI